MLGSREGHELLGWWVMQVHLQVFDTSQLRLRWWATTQRQCPVFPALPLQGAASELEEAGLRSAERLFGW